MSMWQFMAAVEGHIAANSPEEKHLSDAEADDLWDWLNGKD